MLPRLGVNIDHVATLRQLRGTPYPSLIDAAEMAARGGAHQITVHLREDRRHIQDADVVLLRKKSPLPINLEMACTDEMLRIARKLKPDWACLVPEKRREVTTEGGLDLARGGAKLARTVAALQKSGIRVSLFVEPDLKTMERARSLGADAVELHTGRFALQAKPASEVARIQKAALMARELGLRAHAGHGLCAQNVGPLAALETKDREPLIEEYNIGHALVCRAIQVGLERAVREMISALWAP